MQKCKYICITWMCVVYKRNQHLKFGAIYSIVRHITKFPASPNNQSNRPSI